MDTQGQDKPTLAGKVKAKLDRAQRIFLISNVLMTLLFAVSSVMKMVQGFTSKQLQTVILVLLGAYIVAFIVLVVLFNKDKKNLKENMTNYKFAIKVMKQVVNIMNLALALSVMAQAFTEDSGIQKIFSLVVAFFAVVMAVFKFIFFILKFRRKKKKAALKAQKKAEKVAAMDEKKKAFNDKFGFLLAKDDKANEIAVGEDSDSIE